MLKNKIMILLSFFMLSGVGQAMVDDTSFPETTKKRSASKKASNLIEFKFEKKNLKDILQDFAARRQINIMFPETESLTSKITFDAGRKLTIVEAWEFLTMILDQAGFSLVPRGEHGYMLVANKKSFTENLPIYIRVHHSVLPDDRERIRYVYFFDNIQLSKQQAELTQILKTMLSDQEQVIPDPTSNALIFTGRSEMIKCVMHVIETLDDTGFKEGVDILKLDYAKSSEVAQILTNMIGGPAAQQKAGYQPITAGATAKTGKYFSEYAKVIDLDPKNTRKLNTLILMGKVQDVAELKKFIKKYLDTALEQGKSFYHVVELEWLKASEFVKVLQNIVSGTGTTGGQTTSSALSDLAFDPMIKIVNETISQGVSESSGSSYGNSWDSNGGGSSTNTIQRGGNKLILAAPTRDWLRLKSLIDQLDIPQKQVVIEALVMDLDAQFSRRLGAQMRTRGLCSSIFPKNMQAQAGLLSKNIISGTGDDSSLVADLSKILCPDDSSSCPEPGQSGNASSGFNGSTVLMLNGGKSNTQGAWAFFQLLSQHTTSKILTRPVITAFNNRKATVTSSITKQLRGGVSGSNSPTISYDSSEAPIQISFIPLISDNNVVNLQVDIELQFWVAPDDENSGNKFNRTLQTNVSMKNGDILILGGLTVDRTQDAKNSVPLLDRIPLVGNLFSHRRKTVTKDQLFILIRPTVIAPRKQGGIGKLTQNAIDYMNCEFNVYQEAFSNLKDPVTRWFFNDDRDTIADQVSKKVAELPIGADDKLQIGHGEIKGQLHDKLSGDAGVSDEHARDMIGWFSSSTHDDKFADMAASPAASSEDKDMNDLRTVLQQMDNPFSNEAAERFIV